MTNEQLLIYLYGIYPEGGWSILWALLLLTTIVVMVILAHDRYEIYDSGREESDWHYTKSPWYKLGNFRWVLPSTFVLLLFLSNLVPDKKTFLLLAATPTIVESATSQDGKLYRLNDIIDKALDRADTYLNQTNMTGETNVNQN